MWTDAVVHINMVIHAGGAISMENGVLHKKSVIEKVKYKKLHGGGAGWS